MSTEFQITAWNGWNGGRWSISVLDTPRTHQSRKERICQKGVMIWSILKSVEFEKLPSAFFNDESKSLCAYCSVISRGQANSVVMILRVRAVFTWLSKGIGFGFGFGFTTPFGWLVYLLWFWFYDSQVKTALLFGRRPNRVIKFACFDSKLQ